MDLMHSEEAAYVADVDWETMIVKIANAILELPADSKRRELQPAIRQALMELEFRNQSNASKRGQPLFRRLFGWLFSRH